MGIGIALVRWKRMSKTRFGKEKKTFIYIFQAFIIKFIYSLIVYKALNNQKFKTTLQLIKGTKES